MTEITVGLIVAIFILAAITTARMRDKRHENHERRFWQAEIRAVIELEAADRMPSTFDGGAYLRRCIRSYRAVA